MQISSINVYTILSYHHERFWSHFPEYIARSLAALQQLADYFRTFDFHWQSSFFSNPQSHPKRIFLVWSSFDSMIRSVIYWFQYFGANTLALWISTCSYRLPAGWLRIILAKFWRCRISTIWTNWSLLLIGLHLIELFYIIRYSIKSFIAFFIIVVSLRPILFHSWPNLRQFLSIMATRLCWV